jgi:hypothetical protein
MNRNSTFKDTLDKVLNTLKGMLAKAGSANGPKILYEGYISGYQYHKGAQMEHLFQSGTTFSLKREPENPFDDDAVALYYENARIGFIPPHSNVEIARMIEKGEKLKARIARYEPELDPWERVYVEVLNETEAAVA